MRDVLYLAWRYLRYNRGKSAVLVGSITLILFLPAALQVLVGEAAELLTERADSTPLLVGAPGSPVDLTLASLYFTEPSLPPVPYREVEEIAGSGLGLAIPLHLRYSASGRRIVGTTPEYLEFRGLRVAEGRRFALLGEAVLGAEAARALGVGVGESIVSTPAGAFDVAGSFPLRMRVVGVLEPSRTPDDEAVFTDLKTSWVIAGIGHGHEEVAELEEDDEALLLREEGRAVASPALLPYTEITPENIATFHFHGDQAEFPVDAVVVVPHDLRSETMLRGRYAEGDAPVQIVVPRAVVDDLVDTMFSVRDAVLLVSLGLILATVATLALVFALSVRLRRQEIETMRKIGVPRGRLAAVLAVEVLGIVLAAIVIAGALTLAVGRFGGELLRIVAG